MAALGVNPIHFAVLFVIAMEVGLLTPPVGMTLFVVRVVAPTLSMGHVIAGVTPFFAAFFACVGLLVAFPQIALWLPDAFYSR